MHWSYLWLVAVNLQCGTLAGEADRNSVRLHLRNRAGVYKLGLLLGELDEISEQTHPNLPIQVVASI